MGFSDIVVTDESRRGALVFSESSNLNWELQRRLMASLDITSDYVLSVSTLKELAAASKLIKQLPMGFKTWLVWITIQDKGMKADQLKTYLQNIGQGFAFTVIMVSTYKNFKQFTSASWFSSLQFFTESFSYMRWRDILDFMGDCMLSVGKRARPFLLSNYNMSVDVLFSIRQHLLLGDTYQTKDDLIAAFGLGDSDVTTLTLHIIDYVGECSGGYSKSRYRVSASARMRAFQRKSLSLLYYFTEFLDLSPIQVHMYLTSNFDTLVTAKLLQLDGRFLDGVFFDFDSLNAARYNVRGLRFWHKRLDVVQRISLHQLLIVRDSLFCNTGYDILHLVKCFIELSRKAW